MSIVILYFIFSFTNTENTISQALLANGVYQGKNLYVQNPFTGNMKDFCTDEVYLNDVKIMENIKSSAFEIDLSKLSINDKVDLKIIHKEDCKPKILNSPIAVRLKLS